MVLIGKVDLPLKEEPRGSVGRRDGANAMAEWGEAAVRGTGIPSGYHLDSKMPHI